MRLGVHLPNTCLPKGGGRHKRDDDCRCAAKQAKDGIDVGEADGSEERGADEEQRDERVVKVGGRSLLRRSRDRTVTLLLHHCTTSKNGVDVHAAEKDHHREGEGESQHDGCSRECDTHRLWQRVEDIGRHIVAELQVATEGDGKMHTQRRKHSHVDNLMHMLIRRWLVKSLQRWREETLA
uniref:Uncharacterized protein n=1 Tax=Calcidiscus leptoporus TaxID=127549 RepID=A0A7S0ITD4_9EUKA